MGRVLASGQRFDVGQHPAVIDATEALLQSLQSNHEKTGSDSTVQPDLLIQAHLLLIIINILILIYFWRSSCPMIHDPYVVEHRSFLLVTPLLSTH